MESALSPREIQTRIRSGESVADVARVAGVDHERVERFAAPVIAEREHIAGLAMTSSVRRRGETSANRTLRHVLDERLLTRGVDADSVAWDSYRLDDGRWAVTADYVTGETEHQAVFFFDVAGRYSVAGNDEGRWLLGDVAPGREPQPGQGDDDTEPTIDLSDELALVRAIQDFPPATGAGARETHVEVAYAEVVQLGRGSRTAAEGPADQTPADVEPADLEPVRDEPVQDEPADDQLADDEGSGLDILSEIFSDQDPGADPAGADPAGTDRAGAEPPTLVVETIYEETVLEIATVDPGPGDEHLPSDDHLPSDASAVPELSPSLRSQAWEPAIVVDYPVEPSEDDGDADVEVPEGSDDPGRPEPPVAGQDRRDEAESLVDAVLFRHVSAPDEPAPEPEPEPAPEPAAADPTPAAPEQVAPERVITEPEEQELPLDLPEQPTPAAAPKPVRRKRASVPSWDEIVFGGPKDQSKS